MMGMVGRPGGGGGGLDVLGLLKRFWWVAAILGAAVLVFLMTRGVVKPPVIAKITTPTIQSAPVGLTATSAVGLLIVFVLLLEVAQRRERLLLDWWIAPVGFVFFSLAPGLPREVQIGGAVAVAVLLGIAILVNETQGGSGAWWKRALGSIDLSALKVMSELMILSKLGGWQALPYPETIFPLWFVIAVFVVSAAKELGATPIFSFVAVLAGFLGGFTADPIVILLGLAGVIAWAAISRRQVLAGGAMSAGGIKKAMLSIMPWDVVDVYLFLLAAVSVLVYHTDIVIWMAQF